MLFSNLVFSEEESFFIITSTGILMDGTPSTSIPFREPEEDYNYEYGKEQPSDLSPYFINLYTKEQCEAELFSDYRWHKKNMELGKDNKNNRTVDVQLMEPEFSSDFVRVLIKYKNGFKRYLNCTYFPTRKNAPMTQIIKAK